MKPDYEDYRDEDTSSGLGIASLIVVALLAVSAAGGWYLRESDSNRGIVGYAGRGGDLRSPVAGDLDDLVPKPVATTGFANPDADAATIREIDAITGSADPRQLIGRKVDIRMPVAERANNVSFWVGTGDRRVLVVMDRDHRTEVMRQQSDVADHQIAPLEGGHEAAIVGTIERTPYSEAMYSWGLSNADKATLADQRIYIRADSVRDTAQ